MKFYRLSNKVSKSIFLTLFASLIIITLCELINLVGQKLNGDFSLIITGICDYLIRFIPIAFCFIIVYKMTENLNVYKGLWAVFCLYVFIGGYSSISERYINYFIAIVFAFLLTYIFNSFSLTKGLIISALIAVLFGISLGYLFDVWDNVMYSF